MKIDIVKQLQSQDLVDEIAGCLTFVDVRTAQSTSQTWRDALRPELCCLELGMPIREMRDYYRFLRTVPRRLLTLELRPCPRPCYFYIRALHWISGVTSLRQLVLKNVPKTIDFAPLSSLVALEEFTICGFFGRGQIDVKNITAVGSMLNLRRMEVVNAYLPAEALVEALLNVPKLQVLKLVNCRGITRLVLQCLSGLHQLQRLSLAENGKLSLQGLQQQPSITCLDLRENKFSNGDSTFLILSQLPSLKWLKLTMKEQQHRGMEDMDLAMRARWLQRDMRGMHVTWCSPVSSPRAKYIVADADVADIYAERMRERERERE